MMPNSEVAKKVLAASYLIAYFSAVLWALGASNGASGGMAFVLPVILGVPWSLLLGLLILVAPFPRIMMLVLLLVVPPAINVYLILRTRRIFQVQQDSNQSVAAKDSGPHNEEVR
jgi:hypothetical protein